ncbi:MAG: lactate dehydrogenase [Peptostreptococcaceae bacterium]|nr:lactate dehydrogenase [Peptostreptococcaceae bacterium]
MFYYMHEGKVLFSEKERAEEYLEPVGEQQAMRYGDVLYYLSNAPVGKTRRSFLMNYPDLVDIQEETIDLFDEPVGMPQPFWSKWILEKMNRGLVKSVNTSYPDWTDCLHADDMQSYRINLVGLGDVGGTLLTGLRLLGGDVVESIGIYDPKPSNKDRWYFETSQIYGPSEDRPFPQIKKIEESDLFDCDVFVFCASRGVPPVGDEKKDVRMVQFEGNAAILSIYAKMARERRFKGIFAVVSDPVDLLCRKAWDVSNMDESGELDFRGLGTDQIRGYGLGVMHARARFYSLIQEETSGYETEGRAFGPHGEGLLIANSIASYDEELSNSLTESAKHANLKIRETGFKPFVAPALSSGALSILATIRGQWHHSTHFIGGVFMGSKNRMGIMGIEPERVHLPDVFKRKLNETYEMLDDLYE